MSQILRGTGDTAAATVRSFAKLLLGGNDVGGGRASLRILAGGIPRAVPRLPPWGTSGILRNRRQRAPRASQEELLVGIFLADHSAKGLPPARTMAQSTDRRVPLGRRIP